MKKFASLHLVLISAALCTAGCVSNAGDDEPGVDAGMPGIDAGDASPDASANRCSFAPAVATKATAYTASISPTGGACGLNELHPNAIGLAAISSELFADSTMCGTCIEITGPAGTAIAQVVDVCPSCGPLNGVNSLDLGLNVFQAVSGQADGISNVSWRKVDCGATASANLGYAFEASNPYYLNLHVSNHRLPLQSVEIVVDGTAYPQRHSASIVARSNFRLAKRAVNRISAAKPRNQIAGRLLLPEPVPAAQPRKLSLVQPRSAREWIRGARPRSAR